MICGILSVVSDETVRSGSKIGFSKKRCVYFVLIEYLIPDIERKVGHKGRQKRVED